MMYNYPYFSFPYFRRYTVPSYNYQSKNTTSIKKNSHESSQEFCNKSSSNIKKDNINNSKTHYGFSFLDNFINQNDRDENESYFDLFGLKLYNDDLLLIGLIFFLYKEDVKDQYLFIALILLLLS